MLESRLSKLTLKTESELSYKALTTSTAPEKKNVQVESSSAKPQNLKRRLGSKSSPEKKKIVESDTGVLTSQAIKQYTIDPPEYYIKCETEDRFKEVEVPKFIPPSKDVKLIQGIRTSVSEINELKVSLKKNICIFVHLFQFLFSKLF